MSDPESKKLKMNEPIIPRTCCFFIVGTNRLCELLPVSGNIYCADHLPKPRPNRNDYHVTYNDRVTCPIDPRHTVYRRQLEQHLIICKKVTVKESEETKINSESDCSNGNIIADTIIIQKDEECKLDKKVYVDEPVKERTCSFFLTRKKRLCKLLAAQGSKYCGEHLPINKPKYISDSSATFNERIVCPLDPNHTVYLRRLEHHLNICNAAAEKKNEDTGINLGSDSDNSVESDEGKTPKNGDIEEQSIPLCKIDQTVINNLIERINQVYAEHRNDYPSEELYLNHEILVDELENPNYGQQTLKHLFQTSSILGYVKHFNLLQDDTSYIEYGAGKGQLTFWLSQIVKEYTNSNVILIDKASHRHKKDNKIEDRNLVQRIRTDISNLNLSKIDKIKTSKFLVGISKHLCGSATDVTLRCMINSNKKQLVPYTKGFIIALCCHHRCTWQTFIGKQFFIDANFTKDDFILITKMVSWANCGTGLSRERRDELRLARETQSQEENCSDTTYSNTTKLSREFKEDIGNKCKRLIDFGRIQYLEKSGFKCSLKFFVKPYITLENVCLIGLFNNIKGSENDDCNDNININTDNNVNTNHSINAVHNNINNNNNNVETI